MPHLALSPDVPLTLDDLVVAARDPQSVIEVPDAARQRLRDCRAGVDAIVDNYQRAWSKSETESERTDELGNSLRDLLRYGITTGFGEFKNKAIEPAYLSRLQENILLSHAVGVGLHSETFAPENFFPADVVRAAILIRVQTFLHGFSGIRESTLDALLWLLNQGIIPLVPNRGSVGSSGDLAPLAHLFGVLIGAGEYYQVRTTDELAAGIVPRSPPAAVPDDDATRPIKLAVPEIWRAEKLVVQVAAELGLAPEQLKPQPKEGLALTNGATISTALLALAVHDAAVLAETCDAAAALTLEATCGRTEAFDPRVHAARGHAGQIESAGTIRRLVAGSRWLAPPNRTNDVQDSYSVRCAPAVHGASRDAIRYAAGVVAAEINAATDNPLVFDDSRHDPEKVRRTGLKYDVYSAGNFHGQPIGMAADFLAIAVAELASVSERRTQMLLDENHSRGLPPNLIAFPGVNSGLMLAQYSAAALVSENKILAHPSSVDSIPTSANIEDHVAMATTAARKVHTVLGNARQVVGIELLVAAQALEWRSLPLDLSPPRSGTVGRPAEKFAVPIATDTRKPTRPREREYLERQAKFAEYFASENRADHQQRLAESIGAGSGQIYLLIRQHLSAIVEDVRLAPQLRAAARLVASERIAAEVRLGTERPRG